MKYWRYWLFPLVLVLVIAAAVPLAMVAADFLIAHGIWDIMRQEQVINEEDMDRYRTDGQRKDFSRSF